MKLKITFSGPNVHEAGYLLHLTELAFSLALRGFEVFKEELNGQQAVVALIEGDETRVNRFCKIATSTQSQLAGAEGVSSEDYPGEVMPAWQFAIIGTFLQISKIARDDLKRQGLLPT